MAMERELRKGSEGVAEEELLALYRSRKAHIIEYACGLFLLIAWVVLNLKNIAHPRFFDFLLVGFALFAFASAEISRVFTRYTITNTKLTIVKGFVKQNKKTVYYRPLGFVIDINLKQNRLQRFLDYGTVYVESGGSTIEIKDIDNPEKVLSIIERLIGHNRP